VAAPQKISVGNLVLLLTSDDGSVTLRGGPAPGQVDLAAAGGGGGSITLVESTDASILVTGGAGPTVNLKVAGSTPPVVGFSWLSTQMARASLLSTALDTPWYTDLIINPGKNNANQDIEFSSTVTGSGSVNKDTGHPGGVYLLDTGATAGSAAQIGSPNSDSFILQNPAAGPFYIMSRTKAPSVVAGEAIIPIYCANTGNTEFILVSYDSTGYFLTLQNGAGSTVLGPGGTTDTNANDIAVGFDGTTVGVFVDGTAVPGLSTAVLTHVPTTLLSVNARIQNGGTAASRQLFVDKVGCIQRSIQ
jgi:hypothetical protein